MHLFIVTRSIPGISDQILKKIKIIVALQDK